MNKKTIVLFSWLAASISFLLVGNVSFSQENTADETIAKVNEASNVDVKFEPAALHKAALDTPILFMKRHNYLGLHIYDTFYKWRPGGGIYVLENPADPPEQFKFRAVIDANTPETLGEGVYSDPDLSWDAQKVLFCFKAAADGGTSIYEIGINGKGLRQITNSQMSCCNEYKGVSSGSHDVMPAYLPDGRIVFTSTRYSGLVPCANNGVNILHVMNADGSDIHPISVNNVNEFDPSVMPDGRVLFGRWEYIDKTALTQQSMWSVFPDGTNETALFANNLVFPEATLQPRSVPGSPSLVCCTFTPHNSPPRGSIAMVDLHQGKNDVAAIFNFEHHDKPTFDRGESCDPWPLSESLVLYSGLPDEIEGVKNEDRHNALMLIDREGNKSVLLHDVAIDLHNPIMVVPREVPPVLADLTDRTQTTGNFFVQDVYQSTPDVPRGTIKWLRVIEETSRITPSPGPTTLNQTFLVSAALAFSAKNYLGIVPVAEDGSAYFTVPSGKAVYFQTLDKDYRLVRSMRTFIQAAPGTTRSCIGCHEYRPASADPKNNKFATMMGRKPDQLNLESWGSGPVDYPSMVQPILDRHCVSCHGGDEGIAAGLDLTGGWTENFNNSYENLVSRREVVYISPLIGGIDCMNGTANYSAQILGPYSHGSGKSPLADVVISGHEDRFPEMTQEERELILAWIDSNGLYYGSWNYTKDGYTLPMWGKLKTKLVDVMTEAGCVTCHADEKGSVRRFDPDWINLERPELSRILRAPLLKSDKGYGLEFCRPAKVDQNWQRLRMMTTNNYEHAVKPLESFPSQKWREWDKSGNPVFMFASTDNPFYQKMLGLITATRDEALTHPRIDMPNAEVISGQFRQILPTPIPELPPVFRDQVADDGVVRLQWEPSRENYGLTFLVYRKNGAENEQIAETTAFYFDDTKASVGKNYYSLVLTNGKEKSMPIPLVVDVPEPQPLPQVEKVTTTPIPGGVTVTWERVMSKNTVRYNVFRKTATETTPVKLTERPIVGITLTDVTCKSDIEYRYSVCAVSRHGDAGKMSEPCHASPLPEPHDVLFDAALQGDLSAKLPDGTTITGVLQENATIDAESLNTKNGGQLVFPNRGEYNLNTKMTVDFWVRAEEKTDIPIVVSFGRWNDSGWFVQWLGDTWRWHLCGVDCDGGRPEVGRWMHITANYDGDTMRLWQDGKLVAERSVAVRNKPWDGPLMIGNYSGGPGKSYQLKGSIRNVHITNDARLQEN